MKTRNLTFELVDVVVYNKNLIKLKHSTFELVYVVVGVQGHHYRPQPVSRLEQKHVRSVDKHYDSAHKLHAVGC